MIGLKDYINFSKTHGRESAKFLTKFEGKKIYLEPFQTINLELLDILF